MKSVALRRRFVYGTCGEGHGTTVWSRKFAYLFLGLRRVQAHKSKPCSRIDAAEILAGSKIAFQMRCLP